MRFVLVPAGDFVMGSPVEELQREPGEVEHEVEITQPFYLGVTEVTQTEWSALVSQNPSRFAGCGNCPVEQVSWNDVASFLAELSRSSGLPFRLPTEAEWEYACRAGSQSAFHTGERLTLAQANLDVAEGDRDDLVRGARGRTAPVASYPPNAFGLFDMHGNVWEWTADPFCAYPDRAAADPRANCESEFKVIRGGSWLFDRASARCALRYTHRAQDSGPSLGFRVALSAAALRRGIP